VKAKLVRAFSADVDVHTYSPVDPMDDGVWIQLIVSPEGMDGGESFDVLVCTPNWLSRQIRQSGPQLGRHHLIVEPMDLATAIEYLRHLVESARGSDWSELGPRIARVGRWEFEDYAP
jgi:hypothetical protein